MKRQFKDLKRQLIEKNNELNKIKMNFKITKLNEIVLENQTMTEELAKLKGLYQLSATQNHLNE